MPTAQRLRIKNIFSSLFLATVFLLSSQVARADQTITAIPPRVDLKADPGQTITADVKIRNDSAAYQIFTIAIDDFIVSDNIGTPIPITSNTGNRWSLKNWITSPTEIPVDAHGTQVVRLTFKVPLAALPGGHYAMITYQPHPEVKKGDLKQTANLIGQRVGTLLYLTVNGPVNQKAEIVEFSTENFNEQGPVVFNGIISSLSDIHISPKGSITIFGPLNNYVAEIPVEVGNIFPEVKREFSVSWNQRWGYGRYRADLNLLYGTNGDQLVASIYFWLFPIRLVIYTLIATVSILTIIIVLNKRGKKHQEELEREVAELKEELKEVEKK